MSGSGQPEGLEAWDARVRLSSLAELAGAELTVEEGFVLSRVDASSTVRTICLISGLPQGKTLEILRQLRHKGHIQVGSLPAPGPPGGREPDRGSAGSRPVPQAQQGQAPPAVMSEQASAAVRSEQASPAAKAEQGQTPPQAARPARSAPSGQQVPERTFPPADQARPFAEPDPSPVPSDSFRSAPRVMLPEGEEGIELKEELRIRIRRFFSQLGNMTLYEILGIEPTTDLKVMRRGYFKLSKEFHPDRYFNRNLGVYKDMLQEIFNFISMAYKYLDDDERRESYRQKYRTLRSKDLVWQVAVEGGLSRKTPTPPRPADGRHPSGTYLRPPTSPGEREVGGEQGRRGRSRRVGVDVSPRGQVVEKQTGEYHYCRPRPEQPGSDSTDGGRLPAEEGQEGWPVDGRPEAKKPAEPGAGLPPLASQPMVLAEDENRLSQGLKFHERGARLEAEGQWEAAMASFRMAVSCCPENRDYRRRHEAAERECRRKTAEVLHERGLEEEESGRLDAASTLFVKAAELVPSLVYLMRAAEGCLRGQELMAAEKYATRALAEHSGCVEARVVLAQVCREQGRTQEALEHLRQALEQEPESARVKKLLQELRRD